MKKGKLSKVEISYIKNNRELSVEQIATDLGRSRSIVKRVLAQTEERAPENPPEQPALTPPKKNRVLDQVVQKNPDGKSKGVVVMTEAASGLSDDTRNKRNQNRRVSGATTKIYRD